MRKPLSRYPLWERSKSAESIQIRLAVTSFFPLFRGTSRSCRSWSELLRFRQGWTWAICFILYLESSKKWYIIFSGGSYSILFYRALSRFLSSPQVLPLCTHHRPHSLTAMTLIRALTHCRAKVLSTCIYNHDECRLSLLLSLLTREHWDFEGGNQYRKDALAVLSLMASSKFVHDVR